MLEENIKVPATVASNTEFALISSDVATQLHNKIVAALSEITLRAYQVGAFIRKMSETRGYLALGYDSLVDYIAELKRAERTIFNYLKVDKCWEHRLKHITELDYNLLLETCYSKILMISHIILDKNRGGEWKHDDDKVVEWVHKAHTLRRGELKLELDEHDLKPPKSFILRGRHGKAYRIVEDKAGNTLMVTQLQWQYNLSNHSYWEIFGNKRVKITMQLEEEEE